MTRAEIRTRLKKSGFTHLSDFVLNGYIDEAAQELQLEELWTWRSAITTPNGSAASALGIIEWVFDNVALRALYPRRESELVEEYGDITIGGQPRYYWLREAADGQQTITTYPVATSQLKVRAYGFDCWTAGGATAGSDVDTPKMPARWHRLVYLLARVRCKEDADSNEDLTAMWQRYTSALETMKETELEQQIDEPDVIRLTEVY